MKKAVNQFLFGSSLGNDAVLNTGWLLFRLHLGLSIAIHAGWPKMNTLSAPGWFNDQVAGLGFTFPSPAFWATLASWGEFVGGICIALGLLTRFSALQLAFQFFVISFLWYKEPEPLTGMYFQQLLFWGFVLLAFAGGGRYSLDNLVRRKRSRIKTPAFKTSVACAALVLFSITASAQRKPLTGSGVIVERTYPGEGFDQLDIRNLNGKIEVETGKPFSVSVAIDDNLEKLLQVSVKDRELLLELEGNENNKLYIERTNIRIRITLPELTAVRHYSNSDMLITGLTGKSFRLNSSGNGDIRLTGKLEELEISKSGNGDVRAEEVSANTVKVQKSGNGDVFINTGNTFFVSGSGNGDVVNKGEGIPATISRIDGNGEIRYKNQPVPEKGYHKQVQVKISNATGQRVALTVKYPGKGSYGIEIGAFGAARETVPAGTKIFSAGQITALHKPLFEVTEEDKQTYTITQKTINQE